ncbi:hypothetical protein V8E36_006625 [Tilletia maclaganii]
MNAAQAPLRRAFGRGLRPGALPVRHIASSSRVASASVRSLSQPASPLIARLNPDRSSGYSSLHALSTPRFTPLRVEPARRWATTSATQASPSGRSTSDNQHSRGPQPEDDAPPKNAGWRERFRFMTRRYGRWALVVYLLASAVDFTFVFACIHFLGADHIKELEARARSYLGFGPREEEQSTTHQIVSAVDAIKERIHEVDLSANNEEAARAAAAAAEFLKTGGASSTADGLSTTDAPRAAQQTVKSSRLPSWLSGTLGTELVLAYTIHKTALLPVRIAFTAAVLPSFVKLMVRLGWSRPNAAIQQAAKSSAAAAAAAARKSV